jgi:stearoyl-CoA desaturase (delta-9 desaturase)
MQIDNTIPEKFARDSIKKRKITIANVHLQKIQQRFALVTVLIPFLGSIVAIGLLWLSGIQRVEIGLLVSMYALTFVGIEVGFHRHFSHHSFQANTAVRVILAILGSMAAEGPVIHWASNHRRHHQYSDHSEDPHSPHFYKGKKFGLLSGLWHAHVGWLFESEITNSALFAKDLLRDSTIVKVNQLYLVWIILGLTIPALLGGILTWTWIGIFKGFLWGGLVRIFLVHQFTWSTNSIVHVYGSRAFDTDDCSKNNIWLALPTFGGSWHNNYHAFSNTAINQFKWWQFDISGWLIRILEVVGLAWDVKKPTIEMIQAKKIGSS